MPQVLNVRRFTALDMHGTAGTGRRRRVILAEFVLGCPAVFVIAVLSLRTGNLLLGGWFLGVAANYLPLAAHSISLSRPGQVEAELADVQDIRAELVRAGIAQLLLLLPFLVALAAAVQQVRRRAAPSEIPQAFPSGSLTATPGPGPGRRSSRAAVDVPGQAVAVPDVVLRPARPDEADALTELAERSKGHWGYDAAFLAACRTELTVHPDSCDGMHTVVADRDGVLVGYYQLAGSAPAGELTDLFVAPAAIGHGIGRRLLEHALERAGALGFQVLTIDADPNAEPFYLHAGAIRTGTTASGSIAGRLLPRLELQVPPAHAGKLTG